MKKLIKQITDEENKWHTNILKYKHYEILNFSNNQRKNFK